MWLFVLRNTVWQEVIRAKVHPVFKMAGSFCFQAGNTYWGSTACRPHVGNSDVSGIRQVLVFILCLVSIFWPTEYLLTQWVGLSLFESISYVAFFCHFWVNLKWKMGFTDHSIPQLDFGSLGEWNPVCAGAGRGQRVPALKSPWGSHGEAEEGAGPPRDSLSVNPHFIINLLGHLK